MKKTAIITAIVLILSCVSGCAGGGSETVQAKMRLPIGVYTYYADKTGSAEKAEALCAQMAAAQALTEKNGLTADLSLKSEAAENTESIWSLFGSYYRSIGVSKPDITAVNTFEARKKMLVEYYYGSDGKNPVSEDDLKQRFVEMYVGFKGFEVPLTRINARGETVDMTTAQKRTTEKQLRELANEVDSGKLTIDQANERWFSRQGLIVTEELETALVKDNDPMYDDDFFEKMNTISHGRAAIVKSGNSIYVVQRLTIATDENDAFAQYRSEVLQTIKMPSIEKKLEKLAKEYRVELTENELIVR